MAVLGRAIFMGLAAAFSTTAWAQDVQGVAVTAKSASDFVALRQRPLFAPDRKAPAPLAPPPPVVAVVEAPPPPPPAASAPDWELVGLVRSDRVNRAMFRSAGETPEFTLLKGETRDGWTLTEIGRFEVTLDSSTGRAVIKFPEKKGPAAPLVLVEPEL